MPRRGKTGQPSEDQAALAVDDKPDQVDGTVEIPTAGLVEALQGAEFDAPHGPDAGETLDETASQLEPEEDEEPEYHLPAGFMASGTLSGDTRDHMLEFLRCEQDRRPWCDQSEKQQRQTAQRFDKFAQQLVDKVMDVAIEAITSGLRKIDAKVEQVTFKDGIKAVLSVARQEQLRHVLADSTGARVMILVAQDVDFVGERAPVPIKPDQADLIEHIGVVHSAPDGAKEDETPAEAPAVKEPEHEDEPALALPPGAVTNGSGAPAEHVTA